MLHLAMRPGRIFVQHGGMPGPLPARQDGIDRSGAGFDAPGGDEERLPDTTCLTGAGDARHGPPSARQDVRVGRIEGEEERLAGLPRDALEEALLQLDLDLGAARRLEEQGDH